MKKTKDRKIDFKRNLISIFLCFLCICFAGAAYPEAAEENPEFLTADKAFTVQAHLLNENNIQLDFTIAPGYLLYRSHFHIRTVEGEEIKHTENLLPPGIQKKDETLGEEYEAYTKTVKLIIPNTVLQATEPGLRVEYQGCAENGFCYAPIAKQIVFQPNGKAEITELSSEEFKQVIPLTLTPEFESETDRITSQLKSGHLPLTLLFFLGLGLLLAFTPCVLPMVPIMANILVGEDVPLSSRRATLLATLYVLSVAVCYAVAGAIAGVMGNQLQTTLQKPIFLTALSFLLLIFSLNQLNLVHIQLPQIFAHTLHHLQRKQKQGSIFGAIAMGGISALMVSPCVTPALVGALTYIGQTGNAVLGGSALFFMALGMGLPLLCAASIGSHLLPKTGAWMGAIKIITGIFLLILSGSILMRAFPNNAQAESTTHLPTHFIAINSEQELNQALRAAHELKKPVLLDVYADWCISCQLIDKELFDNPRVLTALKDISLLRLDITQQTDAKEALEKSLKIIGPPTLIFFDMNSKEVKNYRLVGKIESDDFILHAAQFLNTINN